MSSRQPPIALTVTLGFTIGVIASFLGIGGGVLVIPYLVFGFRLDARQASGTSLGIICVVVGSTILMEHVAGTAKAPPAYLAAILCAPTSIFAAAVMTPFIKKISQKWLRRVFALVLFSAALRLSGLLSGDGPSGFFQYEGIGFPEVLVLPLFGLLVGTISALVGIGGGLLLIPGLGLLFADLSPLSCRATSLLIVFPTALVGYVRHNLQGTAVPRLVVQIAPACAVGAVCGSLLVKNLDADWFPMAFAVFLTFAGLRLVLMKSGSDSDE